MNHPSEIMQRPHTSNERSSKLDVMNFLNEMAENFPKAISFASGRPAEKFFDLAGWLRHVPDFIDYYAKENGLSVERAANLISQYGRTGGLINELIAHQLGNDEGIRCEKKQVLVTTGCQEAIEICVRTFCQDENDVILARSPAYIGISGVAELHGIEIAGFSSKTVDGTLDALRDAVEKLEHNGKRARVLYLVPDFDNPTGSVLPLASRREIIRYCAEKSIAILEDNPYGMFRYEGEAIPPMYALDDHGCVVYLGTYSKTICPSLRVGFAVIPAALFGQAAESKLFATRFLQIKSLITVNTSQLSQAIVGGILLHEQGSLKKMIAPVLALYKDSRQQMLEQLAAVFTDSQAGIHWNAPQGGFFLTVDLPFAFGGREASICARDYGVLVMPMSYFALAPGHESSIRLAFSNATAEQIGQGVQRLGRFVSDQSGDHA